MSVLLSGCGYTLRTSRSASQFKARGVERIYIHPLKNQTFRAGIENTVYNSLVRAMAGAAGIRAVSRPENADAEVMGVVTVVDRSVSSQIKASDLNPKGLGSSAILVATEYMARLDCRFVLQSRLTAGATPRELWSGEFSRSRPFPGNNQIWSLGSTSALINESELDRTLADISESMARDVIQAMSEGF
ncbi:MAG: hypothetical protein RJB38_1620 [Pseudomonadota bacterium]